MTRFEIAFREFEGQFPPDYILTANLRLEFGRALVDAGRFERAESTLRPAIEVLARRWGGGESDRRVDMARTELGRALTGLRRYQEAEEVLAGALARLEQDPGPDDRSRSAPAKPIVRSSRHGCATTDGFTRS